MERFPLFALALCAIVSMFTANSAAAGPVLQLETGGHTSQINQIDFSPDGNFLISVSDDKTTRVWSVETGKTQSVHRGEIGLHRSGQIYASAISPDGKVIAIAGWFGNETKKPCCGEIRLIDFATGQILGVLRKHSNIVLDLEFSADGRYLVSASQDGSSIVWNVETRLPEKTFQHSFGLYQAKFVANDSRILISGSSDSVYLWDLKTEDLVAMLTLGKDEIHAIETLGSNTFVAGDRSGNFYFIDSFNLETKSTSLRLDGEITDLASTSDGTFIAISVTSASLGPTVMVFDTHTETIVHTYPSLDNTIRSIAIDPHGKKLAISGGNNNEIQVWRIQSGEPVRSSQTNPIVLKGVGRPVNSVGFSGDVSEISWGYDYEFSEANVRGPLEYKLKLPSQVNRLNGPEKLKEREGETFFRALQDFAQMRLERHRDTKSKHFSRLTVRDSDGILGANTRSVNDGYTHSSFSFSADGKEIVSGGGLGILEKLDISGKTIGQYFGHTSVVRAVAVSDDNRYIISGSHDQTIKLWNRDTEELIVSYFLSIDNEWVIWTPQGYYTASASGDDYIGWHVNRGSGRAADYTKASQLKERLRSIDVVERAIIYGSARKAIKELRSRDMNFEQLLERGPPREFAYAPIRSGDVSQEGVLSLSLRFLDDRFPIRRIETYVNGVNHTPNRPTGFLNPDNTLGSEQLIFLPLTKGHNEIKTTIYTDWGSKTASVTVSSDVESSRQKKGVLHILSIGSQEYTRLNNYDLEFPAADSESIAEYFSSKMGRNFKDVSVRVLTKNTNSKPLTKNIIKALSDIQNARVEDTVVIFLAGHGERNGDEYVFLPEDARRSQGRWDYDTVVSWSQIQEAIQNTNGRRIVLLDTCHSGNTYHPNIMNDMHDTEAFLLTASDQNTWAEEDPALGHGLFTYALKNGLDGSADVNGDGVIRLFELAGFVSSKVSQLSNGKQVPTISSQIAKDMIIVRP